VNVIAALPLLLLGFAAASGPSASPSESPLREIGHVRATSALCKTLATHAVGAVDQELQGDRRIALTVRSMRRIDLDSSIISKNRGADELRRDFVALRAGTVQGLSEMKQFRDAVANVGDDNQKAALEKFADALAGALYRQKKLAEDLGRYIAWLDSQQPLSDSERADIEKNIYMNSSNRNVMHNPYGDYNMVPETLSHSARRAADEVELRAAPIVGDEDTAAVRIDPAFQGC
jgi:hypothetical protein